MPTHAYAAWRNWEFCLRGSTDMSRLWLSKHDQDNREVFGVAPRKKLSNTYEFWYAFSFIHFATDTLVYMMILPNVWLPPSEMTLLDGWEVPTWMNSTLATPEDCNHNRKHIFTAQTNTKRNVSTKTITSSATFSNNNKNKCQPQNHRQQQH